MREKEFIRLVNQEIDGVNSEKDRARLKKYLVQHPEAQEYQKDLAALARTLQRAEKVVPPRYLKQRILNATNLVKPTEEEPRKTAPFLRQLLPNAQPLKYAYTFSFGLVAGILLFLAFFAQDSTPVEPNDLHGTMLYNESSRTFEVGEQINLASDAVQGTISTTYTRDIGTVEVALNSQKEAQLVLHYESDLAFQAFRQTGEGKHEIASVPGEIRVTCSGEGKFKFVFEKKGEATKPLQLSVTSEGEVIHQGPLSLQRENRNLE